MKEMDLKKEELKQEYEKLMERYDFYVKNGKIKFSETAKEYNKRFKENLVRYIFTASIRHLLSIPFIYMMIIPAVSLDVFLLIFQQTCLRLYGIPLVKRWDYIIYDRKSLWYLNILQKTHCIYCSYVNWLFSYAVEVGWRTEKYRCPIKNAKKNNWRHSRQQEFADYWDIETFKTEFNNSKCFSKKK